jgi:flagellar protein FlgJ
MSGVPDVTRASLNAAPPRDERAQIRKLANQLEGVFLNQLFQAMRASVPQGGAIDEAPGQGMFTQMFDERMAAQAADHMSRGLGDALYRQLAARLPSPGPTEAP